MIGREQWSETEVEEMNEDDRYALLDHLQQAETQMLNVAQRLLFENAPPWKLRELLLDGAQRVDAVLREYRRGSGTISISTVSGAEVVRGATKGDPRG